MAMTKYLATALLVMALTGCASKHAYMAQTKSLDPPQWQCNLQNECTLVQAWQPPQLTPAGCVLHTIVTGGHVAWECRKPKDGKVPKGGRWIWGRR